MDHPSPLTSDRSSTAWSTEDDQRLMQCRAQGMNWAPIANNHFPTKTPNACRKRHERLMEKKNNEDWNGVKIEDLAKAYIECREEMWKIVANKVGEKWQTVEQKVCLLYRGAEFSIANITQCMEKGLKTLQSAERASRRKNAASNSPHSDHSDEYRDDSGLVPDSDPYIEDGYTNPHLLPQNLSHQQSHQNYNYQVPQSQAPYQNYYQPPQQSPIAYQVMTAPLNSQRQPLPSFSQGFEMPNLPSMSTLLHQPAHMHRASLTAASY
jgi:hypothetical protein